LNIKDKYPVIIVGGGVNGVGIARDCALRGINSLVVEKDDFSAGTSGASSGMIHGGPRYMLADVDVTRLSCLDSGYIQKIAPHLLFRIPFLYTLYENEERSRFQANVLLESVESFFEAYDQFVPFKNGKPHTRLKPEDISLLEPNVPQQDLVGGVTFDEWGIDVPRLCIANIVDARENGADTLNHTEVIKVLKENDSVIGVRIKCLITGETKDVLCDLLINATGPWSQNFAKMFGANIQIRGGKGIHIRFDRRLFNIAIVSQAIDGREIFILPYENGSILGTTDDDFFGDLDTQKCTSEEVEYLLDGIETVFPAIREARQIDSYSGVRPTIAKRDCYEDDLSREHEVLDHEMRDNIKGVISLTGGKLASYRIMAKETTDLIAKKLGCDKESSTHLNYLPGGDKIPSVTELSKEYQVDTYTVSRLIYRHGSRATRILGMIKENPELGMLVCPTEPVTAAEIHYVIHNEMAKTIGDISRRTRLAMGPCQGMDCLNPASAILSDEIKSNPEKLISEFSRETWWNRAIVLTGDQLIQEELNQALFYNNQSLDISSNK